MLIRAVQRWRRSEGFERLQLTPVYVNALAAFLAVTAAQASGTEIARGIAVVTAALLPVTFLGSLLRTHVSHLDAELRESLEELRASRARIVHAGDAERRRLERDLHDGAQSRLVALALLLRSARTRAKDDQELAAMLDRAQDELQTSLGELRELARGIHPAVLTDRGLEPALDALVARAPVPVTLEMEAAERLPGAVESAAYFVVSEALANVAKYARATQASVAVRRMQRPRHRGGLGRRRRRRRRGRRLRPARARRPRRGARRHAVAPQPRRPRHAPARGHPARSLNPAANSDLVGRL